MKALIRLMRGCFLIPLFFMLLAGSASAFKINVLPSVVVLLPEWPKNRKNYDEPEATAVAIRPGGYLVTNNHAIGLAQSAQIRLADGREISIEIVARDPSTDIALLKAPIDFPVLKVSSIPVLGTKVCAVGNQFGLGLSVTCGVVSGVHRTGTGFNLIEDFIQTDATVNPGGSGGALVNLRGELVGLVSAIFTKSSDANIGVNFAISMPLVTRVVDDLKRYGKVIRRDPGISLTALPKKRRASESGVLVRAIKSESAGEAAGLEVGDVITFINSKKINSPSHFFSIFHLYRPGNMISLTYQRGNKNHKTTLTYPK